jgi:hypothetical protein
MAIAVIAGIIFATFLTLILVPVMYSLVDDMSDFFKRHFVAGGEERGEPAPEEVTVEDLPAHEIPDPWVAEPEPAGVRRQRVGQPPFGAPPLRPQTE